MPYAASTLPTRMVSSAVKRPVWYSAATISRLNPMHATDDGTTKKAMRRTPTAIRARSRSLGAVPLPPPAASRDSSGSDTAVTETPNRLIGRIWIS